MINITDKHDCCGCSACAQICPKGCITMRDDGEGFAYPEVDAAACINCGLCEKACPLLGELEERSPLDMLAAKNRNTGERTGSSSGGVFIALAKEVVGNGGVVFGAVFDDEWQVMHTAAETIEELGPMQGSKYVQSRIGSTYSQAAKLLKEGRRVMFTGTPCQIAGLRAYLRRDYDKLLTVEIMCHGVPSPGVWQRYLDENFRSLDGGTRITYVNFRDKSKEGWSRYNVVIKGCKDGSRDGERELAASVYVDNPFMRGFMSDVYLRPACHRCRCKHGASGSDLTIADYWSAAQAVPEFADDKGVSLVFVNTDKGREALAGLDIDTLPTDAKDEERHNGGFSSAAPERPSRRRFFDDIAAGQSFNDALGRALKKPGYYVVYKKITKTLRNIILPKK